MPNGKIIEVFPFLFVQAKLSLDCLVFANWFHTLYIYNHRFRRLKLMTIKSFPATLASLHLVALFRLGY